MDWVSPFTESLLREATGPASGADDPIPNCTLCRAVRTPIVGLRPAQLDSPARCNGCYTFACVCVLVGVWAVVLGLTKVQDALLKGLCAFALPGGGEHVAGAANEHARKVQAISTGDIDPDTLQPKHIRLCHSAPRPFPR